jgi:glycosyltransferase involved in cell wall biosynthesis
LTASGEAPISKRSLPRVSVVVPSYNNALHIEATMHSILSQTYTDFELIVSDHSSTDGTWERLQAFASDSRIRLMQLPRGGGAPANWDAVTAQARGELIKLVCGDDILYPTSLAEQVAAFDQHPAAVLVASQRDILDETGVPVVRGRGVQHLHGLVDGRQAVRRGVRAGTNVFGEPACVLMRRQVLVDSGGWDARSPFLLDQATCSRVLMHGPMVAIRRPLAGFRISASQWSVSLSREQAEHARSFHRRIADEYQGLLTRSDVRIGDARATLMALKRRATYIWLRRRMGR